MGNSYRLKELLITVTIFFPLFGYAQQVTNVTMPDVKERPSADINSIEAPPTLDGEVINDPVWQMIMPIGDLIQTQPNSGQPASEKTEIRITYDASTFYLSVICYDSEPSKLVVSDARRDANLDNTDAFLFIIDTYHDKQNGFVFGTNSIGVQYDAQVDNEGQGNFNANRQQGGMIGGFNLNWDGSWEIETQVGDFGWSAEFAIPLKTIRFNSGDEQTWGTNFRRNIRKTNEIAYWALMPIEFDLKRLSLAGSMTGMSLRNPGNLKIMPYVLGTLAKDNEATNTDTQAIGEIGGEIKYSITPSLTLDLTYNTDFAQVEVDEQQVNLTRFPLFFPEKRQFFLERSSTFRFNSGGPNTLFYSRRIGLYEGEIVPIYGGIRLVGRKGKWDYGFLDMQTAKHEYIDGDTDLPATLASTNHGVFRIRRQVFNANSYLGGLVTNMIGTDGKYNTSYGIDGVIKLFGNDYLDINYAQTFGDGLSNDALSMQNAKFYVNWQKRSDQGFGYAFSVA
ncbi:MAG: carbohydrate binding family 9 domain-containing protein, partial [Cyclobacteriaceae bacterium]|nr:carbohydrate binding family 9 domain-containing protein [Cyclobacteriaceae bacterium]